MPIKSELLADCPFCGESGWVERFAAQFFVGCVDFDCHGGWCNRPYENEAEAIAAWNLRTPPNTEGQSNVE